MAIEAKKNIKRSAESVESPPKSRQGTSREGPANRIKKKTKQKKSSKVLGDNQSKSTPKAAMKVKIIPKPNVKAILTVNLDLTGNTPGVRYELDPNAQFVQIQVWSIENVSETLNHYAPLGYEYIDLGMTPVGKVWIFLKKIGD